MILDCGKSDARVLESSTLQEISVLGENGGPVRDDGGWQVGSVQPSPEAFRSLLQGNSLGVGRERVRRVPHHRGPKARCSRPVVAESTRFGCADPPGIVAGLRRSEVLVAGCRSNQ